MRVTATDWHNGVATPLDPSTVLRVSGPTPGMDSRLGASSTGSGAGMTVERRGFVD